MGGGGGGDALTTSPSQLPQGVCASLTVQCGGGGGHYFKGTSVRIRKTKLVNFA